MMRYDLLVGGALLGAAGLAAGCTNESPEAVDDPSESVAQAATSSEGQQLASVVRGGLLYSLGFPGTHGNGRVCATCHVPTDSFALTPQNVESRYQAMQQRRKRNPSFDDPLFRSIDANDGASDFTNLRQHALVRVVIKLPVDANGDKLIWPVDDPNATEVSVWRSVPTSINTAFTAPYQMDGRQATLQSQALGALQAHSEITTAPSSRALDDVANFQRQLFSSPSVKALSNALDRGLPPPATDPPLSDLEAQGKALFQRSCTFCHGGPTQTVASVGLANDIFVSRPLPPFAAGLTFPPAPPLAQRTWQFKTAPGAPPVTAVSTDPGRALISGLRAHLNWFEIPTLYGIAKTAPYFHDNSSASLEDVVRHYQSLFTALRRVVPVFVPPPGRPDPITDEEIAPLVAYLKKI